MPERVRLPLPARRAARAYVLLLAASVRDERRRLAARRARHALLEAGTRAALRRGLRVWDFGRRAAACARNLGFAHKSLSVKRLEGPSVSESYPFESIYRLENAGPDSGVLDK